MYNVHMYDVVYRKTDDLISKLTHVAPSRHRDMDRHRYPQSDQI